MFTVSNIKMYLNMKINKILAALALSAGFLAISCEDQPDAFVQADGVPTVHYVRYADQDILIEQAYMEEAVCIVGDNLRSVNQLWFNDQEAILNTSYMTANTIVVNIPSEIATVQTDKIYLITAAQDTVTYDFKVLPPAPVVKSMSCEWAAPGTVATIYGDYFIGTDENPVVVEFPNATVTDFKSITKTAMTFTIPETALSGKVKITTASGTSASPFQYLDSRNILFDWDGTRGGLAIGSGWRDGSKVVRTPGQDAWPAIDGNYILFTGDLAGGAGATWSEDPYSFNYWSNPAGGVPELSTRPEFAALIEQYGVAGLQVKFECLIPASNPWASCALQIIWSSRATDDVYSNAFFSDASIPRGLWIPWKETGSYDTNGEWTTVSLPLSGFNKTFDGKDMSGMTTDQFAGLTFFVWNGGVEGTDCCPMIAIDNIRVVPLK